MSYSFPFTHPSLSRSSLCMQAPNVFFMSRLLPLLDPCSFSLFSAFGPTKEASSCSHKTACARQFFLPSVVRDFKCVPFGCRSCTPIIRACRPLCCFPLFLFGARRPLLFPLLLFVSPELPQHSITTACATAPASSSLCITGYIAVVPLNLYGHYLFVLMRKKGIQRRQGKHYWHGKENMFL